VGAAAGGEARLAGVAAAAARAAAAAARAATVAVAWAGVVATGVTPRARAMGVVGRGRACSAAAVA
jgi:hypothetical protein